MTSASSWLVGGVVALLGLVGLFLASRALDPGVELFGLALFLFAVLFVFGLIRRAWDARERAEAEDAAAHSPRAAA